MIKNRQEKTVPEVRCCFFLFLLNKIDNYRRFIEEKCSNIFKNSKNTLNNSKYCFTRVKFCSIINLLNSIKVGFDNEGKFSNRIGIE